MNSRNRDSRHTLFKKLNILPLISQYILTFLLFVVGNRELYKSNFDIHNINTRQDRFAPSYIEMNYI